MKLNIVTQNTERTLRDLQELYSSSEVKLVKVYEKTATYEILDKRREPENCIYTLEGLKELQYYGYEDYEIRIF